MILIIGYGCEGKAIYRVLCGNSMIAFIDPQYSDNSISDYNEISGLIYCVPFEQHPDRVITLYSVLDKISKSTPILIRSTIPLDVWQDITSKYPEHLISYSPSFLRKSLSDHDMKSLNELIIAGKSVDYWKAIFYKQYKDLTIYTDYSVEEAILIKHFRTAFLATKLSFFNQVFDLCEKSNMSYDNIRAGITSDVRIGESHSFIDLDFTRFWRNKNMNNEIQNLLTHSQKQNVDLSVIKSASDYNQKE